MPYWTYIIQSQTTQRWYCGSTNNLDRRIQQHNDPENHNTKTTKRFKGLWVLIWTKGHVSRSDAMVLERTIKKRGIKRFLEDLSDE